MRSWNLCFRGQQLYDREQVYRHDRENFVHIHSVEVLALDTTLVIRLLFKSFMHVRDISGKGAMTKPFIFFLWMVLVLWFFRKVGEENYSGVALMFRHFRLVEDRMRQMETKLFIIRLTTYFQILEKRRRSTITWEGRFFISLRKILVNWWRRILIFPQNNHNMVNFLQDHLFSVSLENDLNFLQDLLFSIFLKMIS